MPYLDHQPEDTWQKRLFDSLKNMEDKLDRLLVLRGTGNRYNSPPSIETGILGHHRCLQNLEGGTKDCLQLGLGRKNPLSQSQWTIAFSPGRD